MLQIECVSYDGEWVMEAPGSTITIRESRTLESPDLAFRVEMDPPPDLNSVSVSPPGSGGGPARRIWHTTSRARTWHYTLCHRSGEVLYRGRVEDSIVMNTITGHEYSTVCWELCQKSGDGARNRFGAWGSESNRDSAVGMLLRTARQHADGVRPDVTEVRMDPPRALTS